MSREAYTERVIWEGEESVEGVTHFLAPRKRRWPPTPITDSIDSSSISWSHNNLGRNFLEV